MYRQTRQTQGSLSELTNPLPGSETQQRHRKKLPSGNQLPKQWNEAMDRAICHMYAQNEVDLNTMIRLLKRKFPELAGTVIINTDAIERRIATLELQNNDYFKSGMELAVANVEAKGYVLPAYDPVNYPGKHYPIKSDLEVFGSGAPMTGTLGYGASSVPQPHNITRGTSKLSINDKSKATDKKNTLSQPPARQASSRGEALGIRHVQLADEHAQPRNLTEISNTSNASSFPTTSSTYSDKSPQPITNSHYEKNSVNMGLPTTPVNAGGIQYFSTPSSKDRNHSQSKSNNSHIYQHTSTPGSKDRSRAMGEVSNTPVPGGSSGGLYRSGKENTGSGTSTTTTGTSILGRDIPGMSAALERRHARIDHRITASD